MTSEKPELSHPFEAGEELFKGRRSLAEIFEGAPKETFDETKLKVQFPNKPNSIFYELINRPDVMARQLNLPTNVNDFAELKTKVSEPLQKLKQEIPVYIPEYVLTYTGYSEKDIKDIKAYIIMDKVENVSISTNPELQSQYAGELDALLAKSCSLFIESYSSELDQGESLDLAPDNFIFGVTTSNVRPKLYYVDIYPSFLKTTKEYFLKRLDIILNQSLKVELPQTHTLLNSFESL